MDGIEKYIIVHGKANRGVGFILNRYWIFSTNLLVKEISIKLGLFALFRKIYKKRKKTLEKVFIYMYIQMSTCQTRRQEDM